jgi:prevent-host-death family protein
MSRQSIGSSKAREQLRVLLEEVQRSGRPVTILRRGKPQAVLLSYEQYQQKLGKQKAERWRLEGSLRINRGVNIDKAIRAIRESAREGFERRIVEHAPGKSDS